MKSVVPHPLPRCALLRVASALGVLTRTQTPGKATAQPYARCGFFPYRATRIFNAHFNALVLCVCNISKQVIRVANHSQVPAISKPSKP
jgi:hypothetical protein